jgi:hypothetical protein
MILLDFNGVVFGTIIHNQKDTSPDLIRHLALNSIRLYNKKFREQYGEMVICVDGPNCWRKRFYKEYKAARKIAREAAVEKHKSDSKATDMNAVFDILNGLMDDIKNNFPYRVLKIDGCEADDIIAGICHDTQEFGKHDDIVIVSSDKDFLQLQKYSNVRQFSARNKKFIQESDPAGFIIEHTLRGDSSDGVPNVLSRDNIFISTDKQTPLTQKKRLVFTEAILSGNAESVMGEEVYKNYLRNKQMIDLDEIPDDIRQEISNAYSEAKPASKMKIMNFLVKNRMRNLVECANDFSPRKVK